MSPCFDLCVQFLVFKPRNNVNFHPFLSSISQHLKPCYTFLQICLGRFDGNIFQAFIRSFFSNYVLKNLKKGMFKACD
jgi:hypothetical protein